MVVNIGTKKIKIDKKSKRRFRIEADLTLRIKQEDGCYIAYCQELELSSHGRTIDEAQKHINEVLAIFFEDIIRRDTVDEVLTECGWVKVETDQDKIPKWVPPAYVVDRTLPVSISM